MPMAVCENGHPISYRNARGVRIADLRCHCGGKLFRAAYESGQWIRRTAKQKPQGKTVHCAICGRRRKSPSGNVRTLPKAFVTTDYSRARGEGLDRDGKPIIYEPHTPVCWYHNIGPAYAEV